jgi:predicted esterase
MEIGFWLPVLARVVAKVSGCNNYNVVQNNGMDSVPALFLLKEPRLMFNFQGARAAQVVPHVHFHIIPRPSDIREIRSDSWTMFGRGQREDLDDEEGEVIAAEMRDEIRRELRRMESDVSKI